MVHGRPGQRHQEERAAPHRVARDFEAGAAAQQRLARRVVDALHHGGGQHNQGVDRDPRRSAAGCDQRGSAERHNAAADDVPGEALAEERGREQDAERRRDRDQQACRAGRDMNFAPVEQDLIGAHAGRAAQRDQRQIGARRPTDAQERCDDQKRRRRHRQPEPGQARDPEPGDADPDRGKGGGPQNDGGGERRGAVLHSSQRRPYDGKDLVTLSFENQKGSFCVGRTAASPPA